MARQKEILVIGTGSQPMQLLTTRLRRLGYRVVPVKSPEQAHLMLRVAHSALGVVVFPTDLPVMDLKETLAFMRRLAGGAELPFLAAGPRPNESERRRLREAGVDLGLFEPIDPHTLRFQINRALAGAPVVLGSRAALRAPADWRVEVASGGRKKEARVYSVSACGAFLTTARPSPRNSALELEIPVGSRANRVGARVVMTNVPGNLMRSNLPVGMGIRFVGSSPELDAALALYAEQRMRSLEL